MLDPWIIEEIRRREEAERSREQPVLELPLDTPSYSGPGQAREQPSEDRGVVIIEL